MPFFIKNRTMVIVLIFLLALAVRLYLAPHLDYGDDQEAIYQLAKEFYLTGVFPQYGARVVYVNSAIPGSFQAVISGLPLYLSKGDVLGLKYWVVFLNWVSAIFLYLWLNKKVATQHRLLLSVFLAFSPWSMLFSSIWNPSFLPVLVVPFFWIVENLLHRPSKTPYFYEGFLLGLIFILSFQLHLSAVLLVLAGGLVFFLLRNRIQFLIASFLGVLTGGVFLIPWLLAKIQNTADAPTSVAGLYLSNSRYFVSAFIRYITFSTGEISRFIFIQPSKKGLVGLFDFLKTMPLSFVFIVTTYLGVGVMLVAFLRRWIRLRKDLKDGFSRLEFLLPLVMLFVFLFSIKEPRAHTFWILMPLSFYTMVMALNEVIQHRRFREWMAWVYLFSSIAFTILGVVK
jgi:hypothetical protein